MISVLRALRVDDIENYVVARVKSADGSLEVLQTIDRVPVHRHNDGALEVAHADLVCEGARFDRLDQNAV